MVSSVGLRGRVLSSPTPKALTPEALLPEQAVLGACVLHQIGVWISATGSRDCVKAGTYRVWCGNGLETLRSGAEFFRNMLKLKRIDGNKGK